MWQPVGLFHTEVVIVWPLIKFIFYFIFFYIIRQHSKTLLLSMSYIPSNNFCFYFHSIINVDFCALCRFSVQPSYQWVSAPALTSPRRTGWRLGPTTPSQPVCPPPANRQRSPHPDGCAESWSPRGQRDSRSDPPPRRRPHLCPKTPRRLRRESAAVGAGRDESFTNYKGPNNVRKSVRTTVTHRNSQWCCWCLRWCQQQAAESAAAPCISRCELSGLRRLRRSQRGKKDY